MNKAVHIEPSILATTRRSVTRLLRQYSNLKVPIHLDVADGTLTRNNVLTPRILASLRLPASTTVHVMSRQPHVWLEAVRRSQAKSVILHVEAAEIITARQLATAAGLRVGIGILCTTPISRLRRLTPLNWAHIMTGQSGKNGAPIDPKAVRRIHAIHRLYRPTKISADVGLNPSTIPAVVKAGTTTIIVGSYLRRRSRYLRSAWHALQQSLSFV